MIRIEIHTLAQHADLNRADAVAARRAQGLSLLCQRLSVLVNRPIRPEQIARHAQGKPYLPDFPHLAFNLSHSAQHWVLVSSLTQQDLGVDVERLDRAVRFDGLAQHAFHAHEYAVWQQADQDVALWFRIWTAKEAILKAHGMGIRLSLDCINTQIHPVYTIGQIFHESLGHFAYQSFEQNGLLLSVAWRTGQGCGQFVIPRFELQDFT